jgi:hypothetical protein
VEIKPPPLRGNINKKTSYYNQRYRPMPFLKIREAPPQQLVENVLQCKNDPFNIFLNIVGVTYSNSQLLLGVVFTVAAAFIVRCWNRNPHTKKVYSVHRKYYLYKQTLSAALKCLRDRMKSMEERLGIKTEFSELYDDILDVVDLVDQVDDIDPRVLVDLIKSMKISPPINQHRQEKKFLKDNNKVMPLPPSIIIRDSDDNIKIDEEKVIEMISTSKIDDNAESFTTVTDDNANTTNVRAPDTTDNDSHYIKIDNGQEKTKSQSSRTKIPKYNSNTRIQEEERLEIDPIKSKKLTQSIKKLMKDIY